MKIGYLCADPGIPVFGQKGCSLHVQEMIGALRQHQADVELFAYRLGGQPPPRIASVPVVQLPKLAVTGAGDREIAAQQANAQIADLIRSRGPFDIVYERYALWSHAGLEAAKAAGATTILEVNAPLVEEQQKYRKLHDEAAALQASRQVFAAADVITAVSDEVGNYLERFPQARGRVHVIANGVDTERFSRAPELRRRRAHQFTVGFVGTLKPWHGVDLLLRAFAAFARGAPDAALLIVGDGPERENLLALCDELSILDRVTFTGSVSPAAIPDLMAGMDVGVAPYPDMTDFYFSPLKVYEYMASGMPVIASRIGQLRELVSDGTDGILCTPGDSRELGVALQRIYADQATARDMGQAGQRKVSSHHTWHAVAGRVLTLAGQSARDPEHRELAL